MTDIDERRRRPAGRGRRVRLALFIVLSALAVGGLLEMWLYEVAQP